ncbi:hypothetical protein GCM10009682_18210 [Luedemannella flava]|uniref:Uncharacterized protein n=1 Tax=Luedemannella flava TaxID=349316 RepID=A0ABN2LQT4_9ACTN
MAGPAAAAERAVCTKVKTPLERGVAGLMALAVVASDGTKDEIDDARIESSARLLDLFAAATAASQASTTGALRTAFANLASVARRQANQIRTVKSAYPELVLQAADTTALEGAVNKLEPYCGRYW